MATVIQGRGDQDSLPLLLPDAGPLITLAYAGRLDLRRPPPLAGLAGKE